MTEVAVEKKLKVLGILSIVLSLLCLSGSALNLLVMVTMGDQQERMEQVQEKREREHQEKIAALEEALEQEDDPQERERLEQEIAGLKRMQSTLDQFSWMHSPVIKLYSSISTLVGLSSSLMMLIGGVGLILLSGWGRWLSLIAAILKVLDGVGGMIFQIVYLIPKIQAQMEQSMEVMPAPSGTMQSDAFGDIFGSVMIVFLIGFTLLVILYPVILLILLNLKDVRQYFTVKKEQQNLFQPFPPDGAAPGDNRQE